MRGCSVTKRNVYANAIQAGGLLYIVMATVMATLCTTFIHFLFSPPILILQLTIERLDGRVVVFLARACYIRLLCIGGASPHLWRAAC